MRVSTSDGLGLAVDVQGDGAAVVLVHGLGFGLKFWAPEGSALLEAGYRVVTYDLRGFGDSTPATSSRKRMD